MNYLPRLQTHPGNVRRWEGKLTDGKPAHRNTRTSAHTHTRREIPLKEQLDDGANLRERKRGRRGRERERERGERERGRRQRE